MRQLARDGIDKVAIAPLARELGVTKGSFYWHFKDRQDLLDAMLARWQKANTGQFIARVEAQSDDPATRLRAIIHMSLNQIGGKLEPALRDWGRRDEKVWKIIRQVDSQRMDFLYRLFGEICQTPEDAIARSWLMYSLLSGIHLVAAEPPGLDREAMQLRCLEVLTTRT
ncbi:MAG: TetR/AcrR family transcriptional regulator [Fimbriimonadaceae bacterium]|nr:TetR/AcrR family transcriptional regulator [Alphaproteobacteria bacterium]